MRVVSILACGLLGAVVGALLNYFAARRNYVRFSVARGIVPVFIASAWTTIYFLFIDQMPVETLLIVHYGTFIAVLVDEVLRPRSAHIETGSAALASMQAAVPNTPVLVLNGFWQVYAMGVFGGFLAELLKLYKDRGKTRRSTYSGLDWIVTGLMILVSGIMATLYGVTNISGLLALQLGASAPLFIGRLIR